MQLPAQVTFRNINHSPEIESRIREEIEALEIYYPRIMSCRVVIDLPHRRRRSGNPFAIKIDITVPGREISVNRQPTIHSARKDIHDFKITKSEEIEVVHKQMEAAINDAFRTARRMLQDRLRKERGDVKMHEVVPYATVNKLLLRKGYGFLKTANGRQLSFQKQNVLNSDFKKLKVGTRVTFVEEEGEKGPEAVLIRIAGSQRKYLKLEKAIGGYND